MGILRLFLISVPLALLFLLPVLASRLDFSLGSFGFLGIPTGGLGYMLVFFHEIGHAVTYWIFGYPAVPAFDFQYGGGMTYDLIGRSMFLQGLVVLVIFALLALLWKERELRILAIAAPVAVVYFILAMTEGHEILISFMGFGAEIFIGLFCIGRAVLKKTPRGHVERYLNMVFGLFLYGQNAILLTGLISSDVMREVYRMQKGGEIEGDLVRIATYFDVPIMTVAWFSLAYMATLAVFTALWLRNKVLDSDGG